MLQGAVAQLGERLVCNQEATGSIPVSSTKFLPVADDAMSANQSAKIINWFNGALSVLGIAAGLVLLLGDSPDRSHRGIGLFFLFWGLLSSVALLVGWILRKSKRSA